MVIGVLRLIIASASRTSLALSVILLNSSSRLALASARCLMKVSPIAVSPVLAPWD